nr:reverse transcriptase domain-containing protein [Tanacetum cinerariifolium]
MEKFFQIFHDFHFDISFADAPLLMPKFALTIKSLLANKDKLFELANVSLNENCSAMLLKKFTEKLGDPVNRIDVIDIACEDFVQDVLDFQYNPKSSSPSLVSDDSISESDVCKGDILFLKKLLNEDPFQLPPMDLKLAEESKEKSSVEEPSKLELKELPSHLEYAFFENSNKLRGIIAKNLKVDEKEALINVFKSHKQAIAWKISDIKGIDPRFCTHKILMEDDYKPAVQSQKGPWVSPIYCVPKKGGMTVVTNENNELIPMRLVTGWRVCIDYRKLNDATRKDHFPLPFMDQILERMAGNEFYCFLDGFSGYFQIPVDPQDQEKTTFTYPYRTFAYRRMPFGLCNAPGTFQRCMMSIFHDMIKKMMEVFMDDFSVFGDSFSSCVTNLDKMLNRCEETNLVLNWEKCHFMCKEGIVLGHKISKSGIEVNRAKVDVITKFPHPTTVKGVRSFLCHEAFEILKACHEGPSGGHHGANLTAKKAYENYVIYKERTKKFQDSKIKNRIFNVGDQVLLFNSQLKIFSGKLKTRWSGPFTITCVFPYGTIELSQPNGLNFKDLPLIDLSFLRLILLCRSTRASHPLFENSLGKSISLINIV